MSTVRLNSLAVARYTSPMPPSPILAVTEYGPSVMPGWRGVLFSCQDQDSDRASPMLAISHRFFGCPQKSIASHGLLSDEAVEQAVATRRP